MQSTGTNISNLSRYIHTYTTNTTGTNVPYNDASLRPCTLMGAKLPGTRNDAVGAHHIYLLVAGGASHGRRLP